MMNRTFGEEPETHKQVIHEVLADAVYQYGSTAVVTGDTALTYGLIYDRTVR